SSLHPAPSLFPYTTLFRSDYVPSPAERPHAGKRLGGLSIQNQDALDCHCRAPPLRSGNGTGRSQEVWLTAPRRRDRAVNSDHLRSEEHTSELQSLAYLVCR